MSKFSLSANEKIITRYPWYNLGYLDIYEYICNEDKESSNVYLHKAALRVYSRETLYNIYNSVIENEVLDSTQEIIQELTPVITPVIASEKATESTQELAPEIAAEASLEIKSETTPEINAEATPEIVPAITPVIKQKTEPKSDNSEEIILDQIIDFVPENMPRFVFAGGDYFSRKDFEQVELDRSKPLDNFIAEKPTLLRQTVRANKTEPLQSNEIDTSELFNDASFYTETLAAIYTEQHFYKRALDVYAKLILLYPEKSSYFATLVKELKEKHKL